ncbi:MULTISPECIES: ABC transporter permease [unclassified Pseudodesulfovibrio]|uniref:ABC transporter permease n=1 Tax=unclassified Pseudodesulfovibrio TaxID=2661612 RepID=UPI000FEC12BE|nr:MULTISPECIES: ABC transporter permease [unclassified Pseudodesulfovibrio]MCJ2163956.1 ABC transporter permease [Pseudodesulfovibrio sp. S3-i]RWU05799.1 ABC transporter permease [Pseudodesulfovibrio sp. S3]
MWEFLIPLFAATVQSGTPILYATLGEMMTEKGGVLNLGVEGIMSVAALAAFWVSYTTGSPWLGFLAGGTAGMVFASLHGFVCITCLGNQVVSGLALTILGGGLTHYLGVSYVGLSAPGFNPFIFPLLSQIPVLGEVFFKHDMLVYISFVIPFLFWFFFKRTSLGLHVAATGEMPAAAAAAGLKPLLLRYFAVLSGGFLMGLGGAYLSLAYTHLWTSGLSGGRGWIAVALVIFAFWRPGRAVVGAYLFGGVMAFQLRLQAIGTNLPSSLLLMLPYLLTILVLILSAWRGRRIDAPAALGTNIEPEG